MATFADRLRNLRIKKGYKQKEVAEKLGVSESAYGYYEQGRREPSHEALRVLSELFDVSIDYIVTGKTGTPVEISAEEVEFLKWVEENLEESFFYDFDRSPEQSKEQMMADLRYLWERENKQRKRDDKRGE